jgi:cysteine synthase A
MIYNNILETIGNTPVIKIQKLAPQGIEMFVKVEAFNPLGSVKDRLAIGIILDAEKRGLLKPGQTVVEATSGNTGIALAMVCAVRGYPFVSVMAESFSIERRRLMRFLGARVILTPPAERATGMIRVTEALAKKHGWYMTQQFENEANPAFHRNTTGPEILSDFAERRLDYYVSGYGTGGTITGVGQMIRLARPDVQIISTEPAAASLLEGNEWQPHKIQGWTPDFIPVALDQSVAHENIPVTDDEAISTSQALALKEGIFCGISSGGTFAAALKVAEKAEPGSVILAMLPDTGERYLSTPLFENIPEGPDDGQELLEGLEY